ncbi:MAG: LytTR family DNA-binding domain-containing protein [Bacteroidota bacterium]
MKLKNIKILIVEDEDSAVNRLKKELNQIADCSFELLKVIDSIQETVEWVNQGNLADLIFMDIRLTDGLSFEIFNQTEVKCPVIFTTAYDEYALQAFKVNSVDYLLKPIDPNDLKIAIEKFMASTEDSTQDYLNQIKGLVDQFRPHKFRSSFLVSFRQKMMLIDIDEVAYLYVKERGVFLKKKDGLEYVIDFFLDDLEKQLDPDKFYRANRQFLVARSTIKEIEPYFNGRLTLSINPQPHTMVIISKEKATHFKRWADY